MGFLSDIFGLKPKKDIGDMLSRGGIIIDVRSAREYKSGHLQGSMNIPLDALAAKVSMLDKKKPTIVCCASGIRSSTALNILNSNGFEDVTNGGGWQRLKKYMD